MFDFIIEKTLADGTKEVVVTSGLEVAFSGMFVVFSGLIMIAGAIMIFNYFFEDHGHKANKEPEFKDKFDAMKEAQNKHITEEEVIAIVTALDIYKRLYGNKLSSRLTFVKRPATGKLKNVYGHRNIGR